MRFHASILTLYPEMFPGTLGYSLSGRALASRDWSYDVVSIRNFAYDQHKSVDDKPAGGGAGMILRADVLARAIDYASPQDDPRPRLLLSPRGRVLDQKYVKKLSKGIGVTLICGRFAGIDQRVIEARSVQEVSIGDYILSGGEIAAQVLLDAIIRLLPGVMGNPQSVNFESFENNLLEHPHYTRPLEWEGLLIPEVLTSGDHKKISEWRQEKSFDLTQKKRPDLIKSKSKRNL
ncbi:tRNA (guanosine(37)-N1)-methyltransferase TrmD [Candidatus Endowatersipora endosymbiont of Watersipora subatra]|uniref:tRNA (guanosine(37)-N1)-methyltransferase TrmD n=1 Tax=Candidatus Endowatersipora endosymbiont of Watersipora subatra TaxID=3077946 RepID=UPI00312C8661